MEAKRQLLEDALYAAIPALPDRRLRARVLALRRCIHAGAVPSLDEATRLAVAALDGATATFVRAWLDDAVELDGALSALASACDRDFPEALANAFARALADPGFANGVAVASPELSLDADAITIVPGTTCRKAQRSLLRYLVRSATKTAPFSTLASIMPLAHVDRRTAVVREAAAARGGSQKRLSRPVVLRLRDAGIRAALFESDAMLVRANASLRRNGDAYDVLVGEPLRFDGRPWRKERLVPFRMGETLRALLRPGADLGSPSALATMLAREGLSQERARAIVRRLIETDVVHVVVPSLAFDEDAGDVVAAWLESLRSAAASRAARWLRDLHDVVRDLTLATPRDTARRLLALRDLEARALADLAGDAGDRYRSTVVEEAWCAPDPTRLAPAELAVPLDALREVLRARTLVRSRYLDLRRAFVERYGPGGACDDVVAFLASVEAERSATWRRPTERNAVLGGLADVPARATVFVELVAATSDRPASIVVNRVLPGIGWLAARHATCGPLPERLRAWLAAASGAAEPVDLLLCPDHSDLQRHPRLTRRVLPWRDDVVAGALGDVVLREDLRLHHRAESDTLAFTDREGVEITPVYLGAAYPLEAWGPSFDLLAIAEPYAFALPEAIVLDHEAPDVVAVAPVVEGPVVLRRRAWYVRTPVLRALLDTGPPARRIAAVATFFARHAIPLVAFARAYMNRSANAEEFADDLRTKPLWVDFRNPHSIATFEDALVLGPWIEVTEIVATAHVRFDDAPDSGRVSEFHCEMVI